MARRLTRQKIRHIVLSQSDVQIAARWPDVDNDISLAKEVISRRPNKPSDWESIACTLSQLFSTEEKPVALKGRGCRERMELLIKKYREEDNKSLKRYLRACLV